MAKVKRRKTIQYKLARFTGTGEDLDLQSYIESALVQAKRPKDREENPCDEGMVRRVINSYIKKNGMIYGQMIRYEQGKDQTVVVLDDNSEEYLVEHIPLNQENDGKRREVVESVLYFGVLENHVVLVQSQSLKARNFEKHLEWLMKQCTSVLPSENACYLSDQPSNETRKKIKKSPVKKVSLGTELNTIPNTINETKSKRYSPDGKGFDILAGVFGENWRDSLRLEDSLDEANLMVNLEVTYVRKTTEQAHKILDNIATTMRHLESGDVRIELKDGTVLKGSDLKMRGHINVDTHNGIADSSNMYDAMHQWLTDRITDKKVK